MPPDRMPRRRKPWRHLPVDLEERQAEIQRKELAIKRQMSGWGIEIKAPAGAGKEEEP